MLRFCATGGGTRVEALPDRLGGQDKKPHIAALSGGCFVFVI